jgi:hypothetical protein
MAKHTLPGVLGLALLLAACSQPGAIPRPQPEAPPKVGFSRPQGLAQALTVGDSYDFDAGLYRGETLVSTAVAYSSDAPGVLEVDPVSGVAVARAAGDARVTAASASDPANSATVAVTVHAPLRGTVVRRQNAGGPEVPAERGPPWRGDARNDPQSPWTCDGGDLLDTSATVSAITRPSSVVGPAPAAVYASYRSCSQKGPLTYRTTVTEAGNYSVRLHFAETYWGVASGQADGLNDRWFRVEVNGRVESDPVDVFKEAGGGMRALVKEYEVRNAQAGSEIQVELTPVSSPDYDFQSAFVSGVEIVKTD